MLKPSKRHCECEWSSYQRIWLSPIQRHRSSRNIPIYLLLGLKLRNWSMNNFFVICRSPNDAALQFISIFRVFLVVRSNSQSVYYSRIRDRSHEIWPLHCWWKNCVSHMPCIFYFHRRTFAFRTFWLNGTVDASTTQELDEYWTSNVGHCWHCEIRPK